MKRNALLTALLLTLAACGGTMNVTDPDSGEDTSSDTVTADASSDATPTVDQGQSGEDVVDSGTQPVDASSDEDSAIVPPDAGTPDVAQVDAGSTDSATPDSETTDAGSVVDVVSEDVVVAPVDTGSTDAGMVMADSGVTDSGTPDTAAPDSGTTDSATPDSGSTDSGAPDTGADVPSDVTCSVPGWVYYSCLPGTGCSPPGALDDGNDAFILANCGTCGNACPGGEGSGWRCSGGECIPPACHTWHTSCRVDGDCCTNICNPDGLCGP
jgi:hypothetical protein